MAREFSEPVADMDTRRYFMQCLASVDVMTPASPKFNETFKDMMQYLQAMEPAMIIQPITQAQAETSLATIKRLRVKYT